MEPTAPHRNAAVPAHDAAAGPAVSGDHAGTLPAARVEPVLRVIGLSKRFGATLALQGVEIEVEHGEIHALVGPNGSGKSTLIKILAGYHHAEHGAQAWLDGEPFGLGAVATVRHHRLRFVHQDLGLINELSAMDNLALTRGFARTSYGRIRWTEQERVTRALVNRFGLDIDVRRPLAEATPVERTVVAIAAALQGWDEDERGLLVLDEPTARLPPGEVAHLMEIVREVRRSGASVLYVSHRLDEIFEIADRATVLRGGRLVGTRPVDQLTPPALTAMMLGEAVEAVEADRDRTATHSQEAIALEVRDLSAGPLKEVSLDLREGEVLGLAGLQGSGHELLPYVITGTYAGRVHGSLRLVSRSPDWVDVARADRLGLPLVPADRTGVGIISEFSVEENMTLPLLGRLRGRYGAIDGRREAGLVDRWIERIGIRTSGRAAPITTLSGGSQQKVVMARCLALEPPVMVLCEPTAGVDIGTRLQLYDLIAEQARAGLGVIVASTDVDDLVAMCTRVLVIRDGRIAREIKGEAITESVLLEAMEGLG
jgi:ABC-type sugar transport system ATPase subunit